MFCVHSFFSWFVSFFRILSFSLSVCELIVTNCQLPMMPSQFPMACGIGCICMSITWPWNVLSSVVCMEVRFMCTHFSSCWFELKLNRSWQRICACPNRNECECASARACYHCFPLIVHTSHKCIYLRQVHFEWCLYRCACRWHSIII